MFPRYILCECYSLKTAVREGSVERVREIINSRSLYYAEEWSHASDGYALLCTAVEEKRTKIAKLLLKNGSKVNSEDKNPSETPLHNAARSGDKEIIKLLLSKDANVNAEGKDGTTALHLASQIGQLKMVNYQCSVKIHSNEIMEIMKMILHEGANINAENAEGETALHFAMSTV